MSTTAFDTAAHPRTGDGKFTTKALAEAGTDADLGPTTVSAPVAPEWMSCQNIALDQAPTWSAAGFEAKTADAWAGAGAGVDDALDYTAIGATPADVAHWREHGFNDGASARAWVSAGNPVPPRPEDAWSEPMDFDSPAQEQEFAAYEKLSGSAFVEEMDYRATQDAEYAADMRDLDRSLSRA